MSNEPAAPVELLGCPWCGVVPEIRKLPAIEPRTYDITCRNNKCPRRWQFGKSPEEAAKFWNTRAATQPAPLVALKRGDKTFTEAEAVEIIRVTINEWES